MLYGLVVLANLISESSTGLLQIFDRFRPVAILGLAGNVVTLVVVALVYWLEGGLAGVLLAYLVGKTVSALGLSLAALVEARTHWGRGWWRLSLQPLKPRLRQLTHFAVSTNISASVSLITKDSELLWVSLFRGPVETGYYSLALSLSNLVQMPVSPLPQATYPELSRQAARGDWQAMRGLLRQGAWLAGGYTLAATLFLLIFGKPLISWLYTPEFLPAYPALLILLLGYLAANTFYWRRSALLALGRADYPAKVNLVLAAFKMVGILLLVPRYGYLACAALLAAFYWIGTAITVWKVYTLLPKESRGSMKIAVIAPTQIPALRANTLQVMKMAQALQAIGHTVCLLAPQAPGEPVKAGAHDWNALARHYGLQDAFQIEWLPASHRLRRYDFSWRAVRWARRWQADLIYTRLPQAAALASQMGLPTIFEAHDIPQGMLGPRILRWFLTGKGALRLVVITRALAADLQSRFRLPESSLFTVVAPDGVDLMRYAGLPAPEEARLALVSERIGRADRSAATGALHGRLHRAFVRRAGCGSAAGPGEAPARDEFHHRRRRA